MARIYLLLTTLAMIAGCATRPTSQLTRPFSVSTETSGWFVRATLSGTIEIQISQVVVVVKDGIVHSTINAEPAVTLKPIIAGPGNRDARRVAEGNPQLIGAFDKGERRALPGEMRFTIPLPPDFDPANQLDKVTDLFFGARDKKFRRKSNRPIQLTVRYSRSHGSMVMFGFVRTSEGEHHAFRMLHEVESIR